MEFFVSVAGEKRGPLTIFAVGDLLRDGTLTTDSLAWHRGMDGWKPIREVPALESVLPEEEREKPAPPPEKREEPPLPPPLPGADGTATAERVSGSLAYATGGARPFLRFWARMFDYLVVSTIVVVVSGFRFPEPGEGEAMADWFARYLELTRSEEFLALAKAQFVAMVAWHLLEAFLIHYFGTTPGKALLGIRVAGQDGKRTTVGRSLLRSFLVYVFGMGLHLGVLPLIGMTFSFFRLVATGGCLWDQQLRLRVETCRLGPVRITLAIGAFFGLLLLQTLSYA